jgi:hypothetical protein
VIPERAALGNQFPQGIAVVDAAVVEHHRFLAQFVQENQVMGDADQGALKCLEQIQENRFLSRVQVGRRLVQYQHPGVHGKDAGQGGAFFLAVTQVMGFLVCQIFQIDRCSACLRTGRQLPGISPGSGDQRLHRP